METTRYITPKQGGILLMIGTMKGAFLLCSDASRQRWRVSDPHFPGQAVYALAYDNRQGRQRIWAGVKSFFFGTLLRSSDDFGRNWTNPETATIKFPEDTGLSLAQIWQIEMGRENEPDTLYCGVEPAALFQSRDAGQTWSLVRGLFDHPHRAQWNPGGGGLCLHTILPNPANPNRMHIAVSAAGVYRTDDGGKSWAPRNQGVHVSFAPDPYPEFGQCVHKITRHPAHPDRLFMQNHGGLYRSDDAGDSWQDIADGVPSDFGFTIVAHPHDPDTFYIFPLDMEMRCGPGRKARVYRTRNGGRSWEALTRGLPQKEVYETVLRDGMDADSLHPAGIYFGTRSGKLYSSRNDGDSWKLILDGLPAITCVKAAVIGEPKRVRNPRNKLSRKVARTKSPRPATRRP